MALAARLLLVLVLALPAAASAGQAMEPLSIVTTGGTFNFRVEIADTDASRARGLMYRKSLPGDQGMLFAFNEVAMQSFWMKNTLIPLDILFVERSGRIAKIHANARPHVLAPIGSGRPVWAVLELNGGLTALLGIRAGDRVRHRIFEVTE